MIRKITLKLPLPDGDSSALLDTMRAYTSVFSISARWGFENHTWDKVKNHNAPYRVVRDVIPDLPSSLVQCARDCACEVQKVIN